MKSTDSVTNPCKVGQTASAQLNPPAVMAGKIVSTDDQQCEIEFFEAFAAGAMVGQKLGALIETGELRDVIFFGRPADASADSDAFVFVVEPFVVKPGEGYARRTRVRYGKISGPLIQVVSGLSSGDRVVVTDMSKWASSSRIHLQ